MDSIPKFIACKHDPSKVSYIIPQLEPILSVTYGCIVYQEQVIEIFQQLGRLHAGTGGHASAVPCPKRRPRTSTKEREAFRPRRPSPEYHRLRRQRHRPSTPAETIYDEIFDFANYAFNKAHAVCYAVVAYQTAYLKCHYPREYMAALLTIRAG